MGSFVACPFRNGVARRLWYEVHRECGEMLRVGVDVEIVRMVLEAGISRAREIESREKFRRGRRRRAVRERAWFW